MTRLLLLALLLTPVAALAQAPAAKIYRTTDEQGNVVFTDNPPAAAGATEQVEIRQINTTPPPASMPKAAPKPKTDDPDAALYTVTIVSPENDTSFPMGPGNFSVTAKVQPSLANNESLQLYLDDMPWGNPQQATFWDLTNVFRGEHHLVVAVLDAQGKRLASSKPQRVFVHRPSVNFRNR